MAYLFDTEEEEEVARGRRTPPRRGRSARDDEDEGAEITLGSRSLLGIFFGLVLVCAIFFGLGYSVGRGSAGKVALAPVADGTSPLAANTSAGKPSAQQALTPAPENAAATEPASGTPEDSAPTLEAANPPAPRSSAGSGTDSEGEGTPKGASAPPATVKPAGFPSAVPGAAPAVLRPAVASTAVPRGVMVQVAAISVAQDADILVNALKKRGYTAVIRNEPQDQLLHVQLGPFASRAEASAMRSKLLADGYNAVVK